MVLILLDLSGELFLIKKQKNFFFHKTHFLKQLIKEINISVRTKIRHQFIHLPTSTLPYKNIFMVRNINFIKNLYSLVKINSKPLYL